MKTLRPLSLLALTAIIPLIALAQTEPPIQPPTASDPAPSPRSVRGNDSGPVESTNTGGHPVVSGNILTFRFAAVDANADGRISPSEFATFMEAGNVPRDAGSNRGGVNPTELLFRRIDRNGDGFLSEAEITAYQDEQEREAVKR